MTILWGDTGRVSIGPLKTFAFNCATPREVSLGTITLPTTEPATQQASFTIQASDLPTVTPSPVSMKYSAQIITAGKCVTAGTISYKLFKNGINLYTASASGIANQFFTHNHFRWFDCQPGDTLEVRIWSNQADTILDYACLLIYPTSVILSKPNSILKDLTWVNGNVGTNNPNPTGLGLRPTSLSNTQSGAFTLTSNGASVGSSIGVYTVGMVGGTPLIFPYLFSSPLGTFRTQYGDSTGYASTPYNNATTMNFQKQGVPTSISFREISL